MKRSTMLPKLRLTLRWMFRDALPVAAAILRTAELTAEDGLGPSVVVNAVLDKYGDILPADAVLEIWRAVEVDLPLDDLGAAVFSGLRLTSDAARSS